MIKSRGPWNNKTALLKGATISTLCIRCKIPFGVKEGVFGGKCVKTNISTGAFVEKIIPTLKKTGLRTCATTQHISMFSTDGTVLDRKPNSMLHQQTKLWGK